MGEDKAPAHLARQPFGRIPAFEHGDVQLYETQAILRYLDAVLSEPSLQPDAPRARARMDQIIGITDCYVMPFITIGISVERLVSQLLWGRGPDEAKVAAALPDARICVRELERLKAGAPYLAGERLSIADLMLASHFDYFAATPEGHDLLDGTEFSWAGLKPSATASRRPRWSGDRLQRKVARDPQAALAALADPTRRRVLERLPPARARWARRRGAAGQPAGGLPASGGAEGGRPGERQAEARGASTPSIRRAWAMRAWLDQFWDGRRRPSRPRPN